MHIRILPEEVASQIAAGEVVERPASVVKELMENSIDAGAKEISIQVAGAGKNLIEVVDNGHGIPSEELSIAISRHATSKLSSGDDLFRISTLGFRGEALASIGSVARLTLTSRTASAETGSRLTLEAGHIKSVKTVGVPIGTTARVEDLFFNVPARLKFLKSDTTERRHIDELVTRYALAYPEIRFDLQQEGRRSLLSNGNGNRREVLAALHGVEIARQMLEVLAEFDGLNVTGFISPTSLTRSNRREITFFVNGRWIQDVTLTTALLRAYHTLLMVGRYPIAVLFLKLPPEKVDVNVHPAKSEVRFREKDEIFSGVHRAVRRALLAYTPIPELNAGLDWIQREGNRSAFTRASWQMPMATEPFGEQGNLNSVGQSESGLDLTSPHVPLLRLVGQIATSYLVAEGPDGLYLIDQHAAHERILFERFMAQRSERIPSQTLLEPVAVDFSPQYGRLLEDQLSILKRLGFQVELFGSNTYLIRAIPDLLAGSDPAGALRVLVEDFEEDETPLEAEVEARIIARVCKRSAIKAGQVLSPEEQRALLSDLEACQSPRTCPHGRPTMIYLSVDLLERQFGRKGPR